ncbi:GntR family transcriptional regulator [Companilactobacillus zhachilii]|uniref:GntR family transcriptional regulator n=1 Tax=Companilactobacillus zhachilii TaxID=2304606 RepID=UPI004033C490
MNIKINKESMIPIYQQISEGIRNLYYAGDLQSGDQIDSEQKLAESLHVSRGTVRKAISTLIEEGTLIQIHGKGTFVTNHDVAYPLGTELHSFAEILEMQDLPFTTRVIKQDLLPANDLIAKNLNIEPGDNYLYLERLRSVKGEKLMLIENRINIQDCPGIENINFNNTSLFAEIEKIANKKIEFARSTYEALTVGSERGSLLEIPADSPILKMQQNVYFGTNDPIEYGSVWLKGNKYFLTTTLQRH